MLVFLQDLTPPVLYCKTLQVNLDPFHGLGSVTLPDIQGAPTFDNCGVASNYISAGKTSYTCADLGTVTVTQSATDLSGNINSCNSFVTVAVCRTLEIRA